MTLLLPPPTAEDRKVFCISEPRTAPLPAFERGAPVCIWHRIPVGEAEACGSAQAPWGQSPPHTVGNSQQPPHAHASLRSALPAAPRSHTATRLPLCRSAKCGPGARPAPVLLQLPIRYAEIERAFTSFCPDLAQWFYVDRI